MNYYKRTWNEAMEEDPIRGWGASTWYFETDPENYPVRQLLLFANGRVLKYDKENPQDEFGSLGDQPLDPEEFGSFAIEAGEFEKAWIDASGNVPAYKLHKAKYIYGATFFGGILAAGYIIAENYRVFGERKKYILTLTLSIILITLILLSAILVPSLERTPRLLFPLAQMFIAYGIIRWTQGKRIDAHTIAGGQFFSPWRVVLISVLSLVGTLLIAIAILVFIPDESYETKHYYMNYGSTEHDIQYNAAHVSQEEVKQLSVYLGEVGMLDSTDGSSFFMDQEDKRIQVWLPFTGSAWENPQDIRWYSDLRNKLAIHYPGHQMEIVMCDVAWNEKKTLTGK